jgi:ABC-type multidrug transport system ATPase subunit
MIARSFAQHPKILILNDPARGIDVSTKRDLYVHLRKYVEEGNTVVFLSSELEEFIGLCPKVIVFRNGTIFDIFENDRINADTLLKGMFGQTAGVGETTILNKSNLPSSPIQNKSTDNNEVKITKNIKVINFDKENIDKDKTKIKIKTF